MSLSPVDIVPHDIPNYILGHQVIKTLDEFARTWTLLSSHRNLVALELTLGGVRISSDGTTELSVPPDQDNPSFITSQTRESPATLLSRDGAIDKLAATLKDISRFGHTDKTISPFEAAKQYLHSKVPGDGCILFSVSARAIVIVQCDCESRTPSLQKELISGITPSPPTGTYSNSFPNLARTTTWIDQSPIDKLEKHLYDRAFTVGEKIDIFGAKISENAVASWGLVVLGSTYAWFIVHLFKLGSFGRASVSKAEPYAWIGLFDDSLSRLAFAATALALPCGTSLVLVRLRLQALEASLYAWDIVLALSITVAFSLAAIHGIGRLWRVNWNQSFIRRR